jgi:hypothetical protein
MRGKRAGGQHRFSREKRVKMRKKAVYAQDESIFVPANGLCHSGFGSRHKHTRNVMLDKPIFCKPKKRRR